jgi:hypothetical protein
MTDDPPVEKAARVPKPSPYFEPQKMESCRWFVAVKTGVRPNSHIGDFATKAEANNSISTKSKYWPDRPI